LSLDFWRNLVDLYKRYISNAVMAQKTFRRTMSTQIVQQFKLENFDKLGRIQLKTNFLQYVIIHDA